MTTTRGFRHEFGEQVFSTKYAQGEQDTWAALAARCIEDVCGGIEPLLSPSDIASLTSLVTNKQFIPGGRYLYYAGRPLHAWNNCFSGDTRVLTEDGWTRLADAVGETKKVWSPVQGEWLDATFHAHGEQPLRVITFATKRGHQKHKWVVEATRTHRWLLEDGTDTYDLRVGDVVPANGKKIPPSPAGLVHGFVFGDGTLASTRSSGENVFRVRLCGDKAKYKDTLLAWSGESWEAPSIDGDPVVNIVSYSNLKELPEDSADPAWVSGFLTGWLWADGHEGSSCKLHSTSLEAIDYFRLNAPLIGRLVTGETKVVTTDSNYGERKPLYYVSHADGSGFPGFKVVSIEDSDKTETVYCPFEPIYNQIVLEGGIHTYQCYLLRVESDTREEWGNILKRASDCLMTGGGIGIDYSIIRPSGSKLSRTGGTCSGPIPLMCSVNEVGRNVMQGGSRRSAIYASLDSTHPDIEDFLFVKDWDDEIRRLKEKDFNFPARLDMTNISVNWSDELLDARRHKAMSDLWLTNVRQAMKTAEPGFSFNFGDRRRETLRNACTEVVSADGDDVCNLGSLNMAEFNSLDDFKSAVELATLFLMCGTMRADLPYDRVYEVREKNRRLGLGLMGIHEWLLKRGYSYGNDVDETWDGNSWPTWALPDELHKWLAVYRDVSDRVARETADKWGVSRPVACRAIAPTGTIGILAGTSTGIEPMFAKAYLRRWLDGGTRWREDYVVDPTAQYLIEDLGIPEDQIETAYSLSKTPERRIAVQAAVQMYVDQAISSTLNLPAWGTEYNNEDRVEDFALMLMKYAPYLRGATFYPDGSRGGQPLTEVPYSEAQAHFHKTEANEEQCVGGVCGV